MSDFNAVAILIAGIVFFMKSLVEKALWSMALYLCRGEFNDDNNESTPDPFLHLNVNTGKFLKCYITKYTILGVHWGFFYNGGYVSKFSFWGDWSSDRANRFPIPVKADPEDEESMVQIFKGR